MRSIKIVFALIIAIFTLSTQAQKADVNLADAKDGPEITFTKPSHDFGTINEGDVVETTFEFKNTGNAPLLITKIKASCGCTIPSKWKKDPILPGESSSFVVKFNSKNKPNRQSKKIKITSNTGKNDFATIKANVIPNPELQKQREERMKKWKEKRALRRKDAAKKKQVKTTKKQILKKADAQPALKK